MKQAVILISIVLAVGLGASYIFKSPSNKPKPQPIASQPCTTAANPCIKIKQDDGLEYKLNDFRFLPKGCIWFLSLPDNTSHTFCGQYHLDWIGPQQTGPMPHKA